MLSFYSMHESIRPPLKADAAALGQLPISAYQHCEALRTASALGWYVFPPADFSLHFDGKEVFLADDGEWRPLRSEPLPPELEAIWADQSSEQYHLSRERLMLVVIHNHFFSQRKRLTA